MMFRFIAIVMLAGCVLVLGCSRQQAPESNATTSFDEQFAAGADVYAEGCAICHLEGYGNAAAPDIKGSGYLQGGPERMIALILYGQGGVSMVNGRKFNGQMPPMAYLSNDEVAAVTAYVRAAFAEIKGPVSSAEVEAVRSKAP